MFARVTQFELDTVRIPLHEAVARFEELIVPEVRRQPGYEGMWALTTPEGKGVLISLWATAEDAQAIVTSGMYDEQVAKFMMVLRNPPGRDHYEVMFSDAPVKA